ncbi:hypothetical protein PLESTM_000519300 [Pleodorina starrii]|nr:hypothetical protein PLESTM_000519300 [Pleodorina starrii]
MLEVYEVFDASNDELLSELQSLQQLLRTAAGSPHHVQYKMLYNTVRQELEERGVSHKVFQQLAPAAQPQQQQLLLLPSQPSIGSGLGLASPGPFAPPAAFPSAAVVQQPMLSVPALYSFGSFGANAAGGSGTAAGTAGAATATAASNSAAASGAASYGGYGGGQQHLLLYQQGSQGANGGMAQAVNAMVAATVRHQPYHSASMSQVPAAGMGAPGRPQQAFMPPSGLLSGPVLGPPPAAATAAAAAANSNAHSMLRNYDTGPPAVASKPPPLPPAPPRPQPQPALTLQPQPQPPQPPQPQQQAPAPLQIPVLTHSPGPTPTGVAMPQPAPGPGSGRSKARSSSGDGGDGGGGGGGGGGVSGSAAGSESDGDGLATSAGEAAAAAGGKAGRLSGEASAMSVASNGGAGGAAAGGGNGGGGGKQLTPWEAAMLAFQEEQRLLRKARKAIRKGPPAKPGAKKPGAVSPSHASSHQHHAPLGAESSSASSRGQCGARPPRPSGAGGAAPAAAATTPGPARAAAAAPVSPHGAVALAAGAAAAARGAGTATANGAVGGGKAGGTGGTGARRKVSAVAGGKPVAADAAASGTSAAAAAAAAASGAAVAAAAAAAAGPADADVVPEEQGLAARTQAVPVEAPPPQLREPSEPESVKTDEESSEVLAAAMREASTAAAAAAAAAAASSAGGKNGQGAAGQADNVSSESDPESVSSGSQGDADERRDGGRRQRRRSQQPEQPQQPPGDGRPAHGGGARSAPAGPMGHDGGPAGPQPRATSASHASPQKTTTTTTQQQQQQQPSRPGQLTLVASSAKPPQAAAAASPPPRSAWPAAAAAAVTAPPATDDNAPQRPRCQREQEAKTVSSESSDSGANDDSDVESASDVGETPGKRCRLGGAREAKGRPHPVLQQRGTGEEDEEEARQRAIAAAAAAAIQGRSAADASALVGSANQLARAVISDGPMKVDRWSDWDLADSSDSLSAWATHQDGDPVRGGHLRAPRPVGHLAPPESLVTGPAGAHALPLPQPPTQQRGLGPEAGAAGGSRQGSRGSDGAAAPRAGSAPHSSDGRRRGGSGGGGGGGGQSDDDDGGANESAAVRRGGGSHATTSPPPPVPSFPRSGVVPAGTKATALANGPVAAAAAVAASGAAASSARRPPQGPATSPPQSAGRSGGAASGGANGGAALPRGASSGNLACASASTAAAASSSTSSPAASETAAAAAAAPPYLQYYGAFHEILTLCYSSLPVMLDAAALSSASVATVAGTGGGGGGGSRPASRMMLGSAAAAVAASGFDLLERYANLLARCEAWQAKLHQLSSAMPEDDGPFPSPAAAAAPPSPHPLWTSGSGPAAAASAGAGPSPQQQQQQQRTLPAAAASPQTRRYVAITDDTAHPEVRNVVVAALRLLSPGWALDPADQVTEPAKPNASADDDAGGGGGGSACNSRPPTALAGGAAATPPRAVTPVGFGGSGQGPGSGQGSGSSGGGGGGTSSGGGAAAAASAGGSGGGSRCHVWNVLWSWSVKVRVPVSELLVWQRVNHFSEARQLTRKDLLKKHLAKYQAMHNTGRSAALFDRLTPTTFVLPKEAAAFEEAYVRALHGVEATCVQPVGLNLWIQKPVGLSRGRGISLLTSLKQVNTAEAMVVQRYLTNPLLVEGHKFDLRLYVLVTSFNPLEAWMYDEGFARFTTLPYTLDEAELGNMHVHLTNSSVQRSRAEAGQLPAFLQTAEPAGGSKTSLATLRRLLSRHGVDWPLLWSRVCEVATATLFAAQDAIPHSPNSFELFGFDMMIDAELKVWLLEVNSSPSMGLDTPLDQAVKPRLIADVLELLAPLPFDRAALAGVLRARTNTSRSGRRGTQGLLSGTASEERELCCADLQAVLGGALPRRYGERPRSTGGFTTCLAPSAFHDRLLKLRRPLP